MPAQGEEVVLGPDRVQPEHLGERLAQHLLAGVGRAPPGPGRRSKSGAGSARGPASRWASAAARPGPRPRPAPCSPAAARPRTPAPRRQAARPASPAARRDHVGDQPLSRHRPARQPPRCPRRAITTACATRGWRPAPPRSHPARPGTRGSSPGHPPGRGTPAPRRGPPHQVPGPVHPPPAARRTNGSATNRSAVSPGRPGYPRASPAPATYSSPATPAGTGTATRPARTPACWRSARPIGDTDRRIHARSRRSTTTVVSVGPYSVHRRRGRTASTRANPAARLPADQHRTPASYRLGDQRLPADGGVACTPSPRPARQRPPAPPDPGRSRPASTTRTAGQRHVQLEDRDIEPDRRHRQHPVARPSRNRAASSQEFTTAPCVTTTPLGAPWTPTCRSRTPAARPPPPRPARPGHRPTAAATRGSSSTTTGTGIRQAAWPGGRPGAPDTVSTTPRRRRPA